MATHSSHGTEYLLPCRRECTWFKSPRAAPSVLRPLEHRRQVLGPAQRDHCGRCGKYLRHITACRRHLLRYRWIVFTQAYPFDHSPDFFGLMHAWRLWRSPQVLSFAGHPAPWGPMHLWNGSLRRDFVAGNRVWCSPMRDNLQAVEWHDGWLAAEPKRCEPAPNRNACFPVKLSEWWRMLTVGLAQPPAPCKMYASIFATEPAALHAHPADFWVKLRRTHSAKLPCLQLESMWQPLLLAGQNRYAEASSTV